MKSHPLALLATLAAAGCFQVDEPECAFQCGTFNMSHCPDNYTCEPDGYCHRKGFTGTCSFPKQDLVMRPDVATPMPDGPAPDLAMDDLSTSPDLTMDADVPDLSMPDLSMPDLSIPDDLVMVPDLTQLPDLIVLPDMTILPDLAPIPDLAPPPDMVCVPANCNTPPANSCVGNVLHTLPNPGTCDINGACVYTPMMTTCPNGCFMAACNNNGPSFVADATATSSGPVVLDKVLNLGPTNGTAPATSAVVVTIEVQPNASLMSLSLVYTINDFANTMPVNMAVSMQGGGKDTYTGTIPGQAANTTVRFYLDGTPYSGNHIFHPGNNVNYTYKTQ